MPVFGWSIGIPLPPIPGRMFGGLQLQGEGVRSPDEYADLSNFRRKAQQLIGQEKKSAGLKLILCSLK